ncbi:hypothetical protein Q7P37_003883 [Cladosporium fusiforme]
MSSSEQRPAPSPLVTGPPRRSSTFSSLRSSSNSVANSTRSAAGSFAGSVKNTAKDAMEADMPLGAWAAAAETTSRAPTIGDIRKHSFSNDGWTSNGQKDAHEGRMRRASSGSSGKVHRLRSAAGAGVPQVDSVQEHQEPMKKGNAQEPFPAMTKDQAKTTWVPESMDDAVTEEQLEPQDSLSPTDSKQKDDLLSPTTTNRQRVYSTGWKPPPKLPWTKSWAIGLKAFGRWVITPFGFFWTIYGLNVVAWGGMLFLILCGAAPEMCWAPVGDGEWIRDCEHIDSARIIWLEITSQILNGLFCVTGYGLLPWRARDMYFLLKWRLCSEKKHGHLKKVYGLRRLAGFYRGWVRLPGSDTLDHVSLSEWIAQCNLDFKYAGPEDLTLSAESGDAEAVDTRFPLPLKKTPEPPLTGVRAPPTPLWKIDFYIWCNMWNTFFQTCLCGVMWGMNRYDRPPWTTGFFIACACLIAAAGGIVAFKEGKKVKRVEGVNPSPAVMAELEKIHGPQGHEMKSASANVNPGEQAEGKDKAGMM